MTTAIITPLDQGWSLYQERRAPSAPGIPPVPAREPARFVVSGIALDDVERLLTRPVTWHAADLTTSTA